MLTPAVEMSRIKRGNLLNFLTFAPFRHGAVNCLKTGGMDVSHSQMVTHVGYLVRKISDW
jgi:hypothetical protein